MSGAERGVAWSDPTKRQAGPPRYREWVIVAAAWARGRRWPRLIAVACIVALDSVMWDAPISEFTLGIGDEICHLATAALILFVWPALTGPRSRLQLPSALAASVLIDLDHVPKALFGVDVLTAGTHRPYGHTALAVVVVSAVGFFCRRSASRLMSAVVSPIAWGTALGIALHLVRDLATGGVALAWPANFATVTYPYPLYALVLLVVAGWPPAATPPAATPPAATPPAATPPAATPPAAKAADGK